MKLLRKLFPFAFLCLAAAFAFCRPAQAVSKIPAASATASPFVSPYTPDRALGEGTGPADRWYTSLPGDKWLMLDLQDAYTIGGWRVAHMGALGYDVSCNTCDFRLESSTDGNTWTVRDIVSGNTDNVTDRAVAPFTARYVRIYITQGNQANNNWASIAEFSVYAARPAGTLAEKPASKVYQAGETLEFAVSFPVPVNLLPGGTPSLPLTIGSGTAQAVYVGGSGTNTLRFSYTVQAGDMDLDGITVGPNLQLNGGDIQDSLGNDIDTAISGIGDTSGIRIDTSQEPSPEHTVSIGPLTGGTITVSPPTAVPGTTITVTVTPDAGKRLKAGTLQYNDGSADYPIVGNSFLMPDADVTVTAEFEDILCTVTFDKNGGDTNADPAAVPVAAGGTVGVLPTPPVRAGFVFAGWNILPDGSGEAFTGATPVNADITVYAQWTPASNPGGGTNPGDDPSNPGGGADPGEDDSPGPVPTPPGSTVSIAIQINGEERTTVTGLKTTQNGRTTVTVELDVALWNWLGEEGDAGGLLQAVIADADADEVKVMLSGDLIRVLEDTLFTFSIKASVAEYVLPAESWQIDKIAEQLGLSGKDLEKIRVEIRIFRPDAAELARFAGLVDAVGAETVCPPVGFAVAAMRDDGAAAQVPVGSFGGYVARILEVPEGMDAEKPLAGVVICADGTLAPVPAAVFEQGGKKYVKLTSLTNSAYAVIRIPKAVPSAENHWVNAAANGLAARLILPRPETFVPNRAITRGEFTEYVVRALGLYGTSVSGAGRFADVQPADPNARAIGIAFEFGIVAGYGDGTFRPEQTITREEAMVILSRAMRIAKLSETDPGRYQNYADFGTVSVWAADAVKEVLAAHVINGTSVQTLSPRSNLTQAEAAQAVWNLLTESKLIDN